MKIVKLIREGEVSSSRICVVSFLRLHGGHFSGNLERKENSRDLPKSENFER